MVWGLVPDNLIREMNHNLEDFTFAESPVRKSVKQGRRAAQVEDDEYQDLEIGGSPLRNRPKTADILLLDDEGPRRPRASAPSRRTGGWGEETRAKTAKSMGRPGTSKSSSGIGVDSDEDDPIIPDLDDVEQEDFALTVANAPSIAVNRVATYKELDNDLLKHAAFATLEEIDLSVLTRCLETEAALKEGDEPWHWETLFTEMGSMMTAEIMPELEEKTSTTNERPYTAFNRFPV